MLKRLLKRNPQTVMACGFHGRCGTSLRCLCGAETRNRTRDTRIFSPLLYRLSYLGTSAQKVENTVPFVKREIEGGRRGLDRLFFLLENVGQIKEFFLQGVDIDLPFLVGDRRSLWRGGIH